MITVEDCKLHCRVDNDADDNWFAFMIGVVSQAVVSWLGDKSRLYEYEEDSFGEPVVVKDSFGNPVMSQLVEAAMLIEIAMQYKNREGGDQATIPVHWGHGYILGIGATSLLAGLRKSRVC